MSEPLTETGKAMYRWFRGRDTVTDNRLDVATAEGITAVEAEARRIALEELRAEVGRAYDMIARGHGPQSEAYKQGWLDALAAIRDDGETP